MPGNYILLERIELNASTASITFANIPQTGYTDLIVKVSTRTSGDQAGTTYCQLRMTYNGSSSAYYSYRLLYGIPSVGAGSLSGINTSEITWAGGVSDVTATASTFSNSEIYIANYTSTNPKSGLSDWVSEDTVTPWLTMNASYWNPISNVAITSMSFTSHLNQFAQYSSFYLFGIKNS